MRLEYRVELADLDVPRFAVEAQERIGKLFTLATLVFNVLETKTSLEIVFHGLNPQDPGRKITAFREIVASVDPGYTLSFQEGAEGHIAESSTYFRWLVVRRA
jgi:hypothetical protein